MMLEDAVESSHVFDVGIIVSCLDGRARTSLCPKHHLAEHDRAIHGVVVTGQVDCYVWGREVVPGWGSWLEARNVYNLFLLWLFFFTVYIYKHLFMFIYSVLFTSFLSLEDLQFTCHDVHGDPATNPPLGLRGDVPSTSLNHHPLWSTKTCGTLW